MKRKIFILILTVLFLIYPTTAGETGTVIVNNDTYRQDVVAPFEVTTASPNWDMLLIDYPTFNKVSNISIEGRGQITYNKESNYTTFTIIQNGSGSGVISYSKALDRINYVFSDDSVFTGATVNLSFAYPIMNDTRITTANKTSGNRPENNGYQLCVNIVRSSNGLPSCLTGNTFAIAYDYIKTESSRVSYVTTYETNLAGLFFAINIDKSQSLINNKVRLHSQTQTYQNESTFNMNNLYFAGPYLDGLYLNLSITSGAYNDAFINLSGTIQPTPPLPGQGGSTGGQLSYDYSNATLGNTYGVNASITTDNFTAFTTFRLKLYDTKNNQLAGTPIEFSTQRYNTSRMWIFDLPGLYTTNLTTCAIWECLFGVEHQIDSASLLVTQQAYAYNVSTDKDTYSNGDIINISVNNPSNQIIYLGMFYQNGGLGQNPIYNYPIQPGNTYVLQPILDNMMFGSWEVALYTGLLPNAQGKVANHVFTIGMPTVAENKLGLRWGDQNVFGRSNALYYKSNFNDSTVRVYKVYPGQRNVSLADSFVVPSNTSSQKNYIMDSVGLWNASITDNVNSSNVTYANMTVIGTSTTDCKTNVATYICFDNRSYNPGDKFMINLKISNPPAIILDNYTYVVFDPTNKIVFSGTIINYLQCCASTNFPYADSINRQWKSTSTPGKYHLVMFFGGSKTNNYEDGNQIADDFAFVTNIPFATPTLPGSGTSALNSWSVNLLLLVSSMFFWGLMLLLGFAITVYSGKFPVKTRPDLAIVVFAFIENIGGLFAPYTIPIFVIIVIIITLMFRKGKEVIGEE